MDIRPIRTEQNYDAALDRVSGLMDAAPGTGAGDELNVLTPLLEACEALHQPADPPDPIEAIRYRITSQPPPAAASGLPQRASGQRPWRCIQAVIAAPISRGRSSWM